MNAKQKEKLNPCKPRLKQNNKKTKNTKLRMQNKHKTPKAQCLAYGAQAQGAIEYLLILGAAILLVTVVVAILPGILNTGTENTEEEDVFTTTNPLQQDLAEQKNQVIIGFGTNSLFKYVKESPQTIGELEKKYKNLQVITINGEEEDDVVINPGEIIQVNVVGGNARIDQNLFAPAEICDNNLDNDGDGLIGCLDPDCNRRNSCEYGEELTCKDGIDNDSDGLIDCEDPDCTYREGCTIYLEDFENGLNGWTIEQIEGDGTTWGIYSQSSGYDYGISGSTIFNSNFLGIGERCAGAGAEYYGAYECNFWEEHSQVISPPILLPTSDIITLEFDSWTNNESGEPEYCGGGYYDVEYVEVSSDNGNSWNLLGNCPEDGLQNVDSDATFRHFSMDLTPYSNQTILLRLRYDTADNCCGPGEGWYIDNLWIHKINRN